MPSVYINAIAAFLPNKPVDNNNIESVLGEVGGKPSRVRRRILRSNGIKTRYYAINPDTGETTHTNAQLTAEAVRLLVNKDFSIDDIDCLSCGTTLADQIMPNHAVMTHGELGNLPCEVVATAGVCVAGMTALKYAFLGVAAGEFYSAVATGSETASSIMRGKNFEPELSERNKLLEEYPVIAFEKDFLRWMLSDGAGAVLLQPKPNSIGVSLKIHWIYERSYANEISACMYSGAVKLSDGSLRGWKEFAPEEWLSDSIFSVKQDVKQLNENVIHYTVERPLAEIVEKKGLNPGEIDYFLPHYSSKYFKEKVADGMKKIGFEIPFERWFTNLSSKGNTGSASIYIMLEELFQSGKLKQGEKILCYIPESGRFSSAYMLLSVCKGL
ncbi:MAG: beta-ketoacyl-ACP synthase III [Xanthomonadales bacterium]|nr:beta-ketoacyl-ACP synthase III [Xanthomonadales bacterium]